MTTTINRVIVSSNPYCLQDSVHLTRPGFDTFLSTDESRLAAPVDKRQAKRLYRLQSKPNVNSDLFLDKLHVDDPTETTFDRTLRQQIENSSLQSTKGVYIRPLDVSNASLSKYTLGNTRHDPHQLIPSEITAVRCHPAAKAILRHEKGPDGEIVPRFSDRPISDRVIRTRLGPGGILNHGEDCREAMEYLQKHPHVPSNSPAFSPRSQEPPDLRYTSMQRTAYADIPWDTVLPSQLPAPLTAYEANGSDPLLKSKVTFPTYDFRSSDVLAWDLLQTRNTRYNRKPFENVAPLPRAKQIPGYSGSFGGAHLEDIENPDIDFTPYTIVRTEQPKFTLNPFKTNIPLYTGKTQYGKLEPVSHYDRLGQGYTTTADFHRPLPPIDSYIRHGGRHGDFARTLTAVIPQNPFNKLDITSQTTNSSIDSRSQIIVRGIPTKPAPRIQENPPQENEIINNTNNNP